MNGDVAKPRKYKWEFYEPMNRALAESLLEDNGFRRWDSDDDPWNFSKIREGHLNNPELRQAILVVKPDIDVDNLEALARENTERRKPKTAGYKTRYKLYKEEPKVVKEEEEKQSRWEFKRDMEKPFAETILEDKGFRDWEADGVKYDLSKITAKQLDDPELRQAIVTILPEIDEEELEEVARKNSGVAKVTEFAKKEGVGAGVEKPVTAESPKPESKAEGVAPGLKDTWEDFVASYEPPVFTGEAEKPEEAVSEGEVSPMPKKENPSDVSGATAKIPEESEEVGEEESTPEEGEEEGETAPEETEGEGEEEGAEPTEAIEEEGAGEEEESIEEGEEEVVSGTKPVSSEAIIGNDGKPLTAKDLDASVAWTSNGVYKMIYPPYGLNNIISRGTPFPQLYIYSDATQAFSALVKKVGGRMLPSVLQEIFPNISKEVSAIKSKVTGGKMVIGKTSKQAKTSEEANSSQSLTQL